MQKLWGYLAAVREQGAGAATCQPEGVSVKTRVARIECAIARQNAIGLGGDNSGHAAADRKAGALSWWPGRDQSRVDAAGANFNANLCPGSLPHAAAEGIRADSKVHADIGLWAFETFNANAWTSLLGYIQRTAADFLVGQETKLRAGDDIASAEDAMANKGWRGRITPCNNGPAGGPSAGTTVMARRHIGLSHPPSGPLDGGGRVQLQQVSAVCKGGLHLGSIYLTDLIGPSAPPNLAVLDTLAAALALVKGPWLIGGDFNCTPEELAQTGFLDLVQGVAHYPDDATCGAKTYDYFVVC